jgi:hypothetical protein
VFKFFSYAPDFYQEHIEAMIYTKMV